MKPIWPKMLRIGEDEWFAWNADQADLAVRLARIIVAGKDLVQWYAERVSTPMPHPNTPTRGTEKA